MFDIEAAKKAGYSESEILEHLASSRGYNLQGAKSSGYSNTEIMDYLSKQGSTAAAPPTRVTGRREAPEWQKQVVDWMGRTARNIPGSAIETIKGLGKTAGMLAPTAEAPIPGGPLAKGLGEYIGGGITGAIRSIAPSLTPNVPRPPEEAFRKQITEPLAGMIERPETIPGKVAEYVEKHPVEVALDVLPYSRLLKTARTASEVSKAKDIAFAVDKGFTKGITAGMEGAKKYASTQKYLEQATNASMDIVHNKNAYKLTNEAGEIITGRVPYSLREAAQAVEYGMQNTFEKFNAMQEAATGAGIKLPLSPIAQKLRNYAGQNVVQKEAPEVAKYALEKANRYSAQSITSGGPAKYAHEAVREQFYTPKEMQEAIKQFNSSLDAYYQNRSYEAARKVDVDAMVVREMRKDLDKAITEFKGPGYQELKDLYGSYKTVEGDIVKKFNAEAKKVGGAQLIDATDIYSVGEILTGLATMHPLMIAKGASFAAAKKLMKSYWSPDNRVKRMFTKVDELMTERPAGVGPVTKAGMAAGPMATVGRNVPLTDEDLQARIKEWLESEEKK